MVRRVLLALAVVTSVVLIVAGNAFTQLAEPFLGDATAGFQLFLNAVNLLALTFIAVGALLSLRVPSNPIGPAMIVGALGIQAVFVGWPMIVTAGIGDWPMTPALIALGWIANVALNPSLFMLFGVVGVLFPDGHLPDARWRLPMAAVAGTVIVGEALRSIAPWEGDLPTGNPIAIAGLPPGLAEIGGAISTAALCAGLLLAVVAIVVRFRRAGPVERAQIKWLVAALSLNAIALPLSLATEIGPVEVIDLASVLIGCLTPIAIGVAILRYRLYDIDRLVSRTVSWGLVTGALLAVFGVLMIGLQALLADLTTQGGTVAVAVSTLVAAALFQPLRQRVQRVVDRRFDRSRYDAERTAEAFAQRLSTEVDLDTLAAELQATAGQAVRPASAAIWLASRSTR